MGLGMGEQPSLAPAPAQGPHPEVGYGKPDGGGYGMEVGDMLGGGVETGRWWGGAGAGVGV